MVQFVLYFLFLFEKFRHHQIVGTGSTATNETNMTTTGDGYIRDGGGGGGGGVIIVVVRGGETTEEGLGVGTTNTKMIK